MTSYQRKLVQRTLGRGRARSWAATAMRAATLAELVQTAVVQTATLLPGAVCVLFLVEEQTLVPKAAEGFALSTLPHPIAFGKSVSGRLVLRGEPALFANVASLLASTADNSEPYLAGSLASAPLVFGDRVIGLLNACRSPPQEPFTHDDVERLVTFANQLAFSVVAHRLVEERTAELQALNQRLHVEIAERKRVESSLDLERKQLLSVFDSTDEPIYVADPETYEILYANQSLRRQFGSAVGSKCFVVLQGRQSPCEFCTNDKILGDNVDQPYIWETQNATNGRWYRCIDKAIRWPDGRRVRYEMALDITERRLAEEQQARLSSIIESSQDPIGLVTEEGRLSYLNDAARRSLGVGGEGEPDSVSLYDLFPQQLHPALRALLAEAGSYRGEHSLRHSKTREAFHVEVSLFPLARASARETVPLAMVLRDLTARRLAEEQKARLQAQLLQAQKMEAIGRLAGGVAHDFNNILTSILAYSDLLLSALENDEENRLDVLEIKQSALRAAALTQQLLAFSRRQMVTTTIVNVNSLVSASQRMLGRIIGEDVQLDVDLAESLWSVRADPNQIDMVLMNLAVNARDAMPQGGVLGLRTANVVVTERTGEALGIPPGDYVEISVSDNGCGMDSATLSLAFEPFFSTKGKDRGTGLGLSTVYGIVSQNRGAIAVESSVGAGSTFRVYLPRTFESAAPAPRDPSLPPGTGSEPVLLVEDDSTVRALVKRVLESKGYAVLVASDAQEAIALWDQTPGRIVLLLTDVVMPGLNGKQLFDFLQARDPNLRVLFMSGYTNDVIASHGVAEQSVPLLQKPFTAETLTARVRQVLDR